VAIGVRRVDEAGGDHWSIQSITVFTPVPLDLNASCSSSA
jgi:hypothetical protein